MREDTQDRALETLLQQSFSLSQAQEDQLWARFEERRKLETIAWAAFATHMALLSTRLRSATRPIYGVGGLTLRHQGGAV